MEFFAQKGSKGRDAQITKRGDRVRKGHDGEKGPHGVILMSGNHGDPYSIPMQAHRAPMIRFGRNRV
jgi:hypothetical protein